MATKLRLFFEAVVRFFKFFERRRQRLAAEKVAERAHQAEMFDMALRAVVDAVREQQKPLLQALENVSAQTDLIASWLKSFHVVPADAPQAPAEPSKPDWLRDIEEEAGESIPPEFALAFALQRAEGFPDPE